MNLRTHETYCTQKCIVPCTSIPQSLHSKRWYLPLQRRNMFLLQLLIVTIRIKVQLFEFSYNLHKFLSCFLILSSMRGASVCYFLNSLCIYYKCKPLDEIDYISLKHANKEKFYACRILSQKKFSNFHA